MLFHKEIVPGQKIAYRDLAERLGMSLTPVIQALKWLEIQGLVRRERNRGYYTEPFSLQEVEELYDLREIVELSLLPKTMHRLNERGLKRLHASLKAHLKASRETYLNERFIKDMEFHLTLASLSECRVQQHILRNLLDTLCLKYRGSFLSATSIEATETEHQEIYEAISAKDLKRAHKALSTHIGNVRKSVLASFTKILAEKKGLGLSQGVID